MKLDKTSFKTYAVVVKKLIEGTNKLERVALEAHNLVASVPAVVEHGVQFVERRLEEIVLVLSNFTEALEDQAKTEEEKLYPPQDVTVMPPDLDTLLARKAERDAEDPTTWSLDRQADYIADGFGVQRNASSIQKIREGKVSASFIRSAFAVIERRKGK